MLRVHQIRSAADCKSYYAQTDYYGQELVGNWGGKAAARLGLEGPVTLEAFNRLCDNLDPASGEQHTARQKSNRTVGYDFNFNSPKGVSLLYALTGDERILDAFRTAVADTMRELGQEAKTRVRKAGRYEDHVTANLAWGEFVHFTARPVDGASDPSLHAHMVVFNATHDASEDRWKAAQFRWLKADAPYWEAAFHARLAGNLEALGYATERRGKHWDVASVARPTVEKFSRRTAQIERVAAEEGIVAPEAKARLGQTTRQKKDKEQPWDQLVEGWRRRLTTPERQSLEQARRQAVRPRPPHAGAEEASVRYAAEHLFARKSVIGDRELLAESLRHGVGHVSVGGVQREAGKLDLILRAEGDRLQATRQQVLAEERRLIAVARVGRGTKPRLGARGGGGPHRTELSADQRRALDDMLASTGFITLFEAPAGTGKTKTATALRAAVEATGKAFVAVAPSAQASRGVLRGEGFQGADTLTMLLTNRQMQEGARGGVIFVDEAGMVGVPTMLKLTDLAQQLDARIVLAGDRRQHHAIERGDALRLLADEAKLPVARLSEIWRQKAEYRKAVERFQAGDAGGGLKKLDALGWVAERDKGTLYDRAADIYTGWRAELIAAGKDPMRDLLAVSPTNAEAARTTTAIRSRLKAEGVLGEERELLQLVPAHLTDAEKADRHSYQPGDVLQFHKAVPGVKPGQRIKVAGDEALPLQHPERFSVFRKGTVRLAVGDLVRPTAGGGTKDGHRVDNGQTYSVAGFTKGGDVCLDNGWVVSKDFGTWNHGYLSTEPCQPGAHRPARAGGAIGPLGACDQRHPGVRVGLARQAARPGADRFQGSAAGGGRARGPPHQRHGVRPPAAPAAAASAATPRPVAAAAGRVNAAARAGGRASAREGDSARSTGKDGYETLLARAAGKNQSPTGEEETCERFYAFVTGIQDRSHNIEFRKAEDSWPFLEYSYLVGGEAVHAGEFVLRFATGERVTVRGRNLRPLYEKLLRHRVTWLREAATGETAPDRELFIDEIEVKDEEGKGGSSP